MMTELQTCSGTDRYTAHGLSLPRSVINALHKRGIYCQPAVSLEHQHLANRYVLRGVESGGAVSDIGRACAFVAADGSSLPWLQPIDSLGVNRRHAIYLAENMVRFMEARSSDASRECCTCLLFPWGRGHHITRPVAPSNHTDHSLCLLRRLQAFAR